MNNPRELKIKSIPDEHQLDYFTPSFDQHGFLQPPPDNFIISRNIDRSVLSRYGDRTWDLSPYELNSKKCRLHFISSKTATLPEDYIRQTKSLMMCLMYLSPWALSTSTYATFLFVLSSMAVHCHKSNISRISCVLADYSKLKRFIAATKPVTGAIVVLLQIVSHLDQAGKAATGLTITSDKRIVELRAEVQKLKKESGGQTLPIPSRIYLMRIEQLKASLDDFVAHQDEIISLFRDCLNGKAIGYGRTKEVQGQRGRSKSLRKSTVTGKLCPAFLPDFPEALSNHGLTAFARNHGFSTVQGFSTFLTKVRCICKHQIHLYSGMRDDEVISLRYNCLAHESMSFGESIFLVGVTTKMSRSRKPDRWVTCKAVEPAINLAQAIAKVIAEYFDYTLEECSLFISHGYLSSKYVVPKPYEPIRFETKKYDPPSFLVHQSDIAEIERVQLDVNWKKYPGIKVGKSWPFTSHQYRRSLAIYGSNSGLIELSSLKYQLKHITDSMTMYYGQGSQRAVDILGDCQGDHFIEEYQQRKPVSDVIVYIRDYLLSDEPLIGGKGIMLSQCMGGTNRNIIQEERRQTELRFRKGEMAFKETPLGACTSTEKCDSRLNIDFTSCISCPNAILKPSKVDRFVNEIEQSMQNLPPESVEYRLEKAQLKDLWRLQRKMAQYDEEDLT